MSLPLRDRPEFATGAAAERMVAGWLQSRGWHVIPSYDYAGAEGDKPPRLQGELAEYAVPDLDIARDGQRRWVEVKYKAAAAWYRVGQCFQHGIPARLLDHYQQVERITGTECWLAIYQADTRELLIARLSDLGEPQRGTFAGQRMAYWPVTRFRVLHTFTEGPA